jgi:ABC-2 type transport system ATP-binding protein
MASLRLWRGGQQTGRVAPPIEVVGLGKHFGQVKALEDVDMVVEAGEVHGLLGPNGAGKSTFLRILFGLVHPDAGTVRLFGRAHHVDGLAAALEGVGGFVERPQFYPYLSARRTLKLLAAADGLGAEGSVDDVLAHVGLLDAADRRITGWSTGMLQRLGLAAALLRRPRLLLLDEPTEGLDPAAARTVIALVRTLADEGVTVLLSSHDMAEVDLVCDRVTILYHGRVARSAPLAELRATAPTGRHRLVTSDDDAARTIAAGYAVTIEPHPRGGFLLQAAPDDLHELVCALGRSGVSVRLLEQEVSPLTAMFYALTETPEPLVGAK